MEQLCIKHGSHAQWSLLYGSLIRCDLCLDDSFLDKKIKSLKSRNKQFNLNLDFVKSLLKAQGNRCALTGQTFDSVEDISIDRIDSSEGYTQDNVQLVTKHANVAKWDKTTEEFIKLCKQVVEFNQTRSLKELVNPAGGASQPPINPAGKPHQSVSAPGPILGEL